MEVDDNHNKNDPPLPPNYVSLAVLQQRWLHRKQQEKEEERQKAQVDSKSRHDVKPTTTTTTTTKGFSNRGPRIEGQHVSAGFPRVNQREIGEGKYWKIIHGFEKGRMGGGKEHGFGKIIEEKDCSRRQGKNMSCNAGVVRGAASVFMVQAVPEIRCKEIKPVELISQSDGKTVKDRDNLRKNVSCNAGVEGRVSVFRAETVPEIGSKQIKPMEFSRKVDGKTVQDRGNVRKNLSCNSGDNEGTANEAVPEISSKQIKPVEFSRKVDGKTVHDRGNVRKNLSCNSGDNEGTASEAVPGIVSKETKPAELISKSDGKTVQDKGNVRKNLSCDPGVEGTASVLMVEVVPEIVSKESKPVEFIRKSDGITVKGRDNLRKYTNWRVKGSGRKYEVEELPENTKSSSRKSEVEELPENTMKKEDLGVLIGENAPINGDDDGCVVEGLLEDKEKEGALLGSGNCKDSKRNWKKKSKAKKRDSKDKNTLEETMEKGTEDEVLTGDNGSSVQDGTRGRNVQGYRHRGNNVLGTKITRNCRDLSFFERRGNFRKYPRYQVMQKPAVWVKRGEISATNVDESGNSGPSKLESTGMSEGEKEAEAKSADLNRRS